ncbi:2,4'-dihydroxyacetophenone dioxygenase family protein [Pyruvatibacter sp.]|uniref:2,4'-dihydroxyacetophenone dioxygenase family protein n=1 Tax=Pyruvatibacter sp. TaxID=1981328 RepID=UPI0032ECA44B
MDTKPDDAITAMATPVVPPASGEALHIGENDLPFVDLGDGTKIQLQQVDLTQGLWVLRTKFAPGYQVATHYHTGPVFAVTFTGSWHYREYPDVVNTKGSYLFEPAGSVHTLIVPDTNTEETDVWFAIYGPNINTDETGQVTGILDANSILNVYRAMCDDQGLAYDKLIVIGEDL